jgi:hypothetical protein
MNALRRLDPFIPLVLLLSVFAVAPLTAPGFFLNAHDATIGVYFLWQFDAGIRDGAWWPVWGAHMVYGYGYPLFMLIAPLAYYVAEGFLLLGLGMVGAIKGVYALAFLASGLAMYLFARRGLGRYGGLAAAVAYVYIPYHLVDIYVRADMAEFAAMAFFPAVLWALDYLMSAVNRRQRATGIAATALLYAGLVLTHFTMGVIFSPVAAAYALWRGIFPDDQPRGRLKDLIRRLAPPAAALALGLALSAAFFLPALAELRYVKTSDLAGGYFSYAKHFVYLFQFISPLWDYGYAGEGPLDQMPYQLGVVPVVLALLALGLVIGVRSNGFSRSNPVSGATPAGDGEVRSNSTNRSLLVPGVAHSSTIFFLLLTGVLVFLMLGASQPLWDLFKPIVAFIQFPWRLLVLTAVSLSFLAGVVVAYRRAAAPLVLVLIILASYSYATPRYTDAEVSLAKMMAFQVRTGEMLGDTIWVSQKPMTSPLVPQYLAGQPLARVVALTPGASAETTHEGGASVKARVSSPAGAGVGIYTRYFPGWQATVDGAPVEVTPWGEQGLMQVQVPAGEHTLALRFGDTPARTAGKAVSLLALAVVAGVWLWGRRLA